MIRIMTKNFQLLFKKEIKFNSKFINHEWLYNKILDCENDLQNKRYNISTNIGLILENLLRDSLFLFNKDEAFLKSKNINDLINSCCNYISLESYVVSSLHMLKSSRNNFSHSSDLSIHGPTEIDCANMLRSLQIILYYFFKEIYKIELDSEILGSFSLEVYNINKSQNIVTENDIKRISNFSNNVSEDIYVNKIPIFRFLFGELKKKFSVPIYQRGYDWDEENVNAMCNDILKRMKDNHSHYFGVIAIKKENINTKDEIINVKILDGQQRITTTLLLIAAIKSHIKSNYKNYLDKIQMFKKIDEYTLKNNIKLEEIIENPGTTNDLNIEFKYILSGKDMEFKYSYGKNLKIIKEFLNNNLNNLSDLINFISVLEEKLMVAVVDFDPNYVRTKKELEIFENLNSKGKSLKSFDLIKNSLFNLCSNDVLEKREKDIVIYFNTKISSEFNSVTEDIKEFFEHFIMYYLGEEIKSKNKDINTFKKFKEVINGNDKNIKGLLKELKISNHNDGIDFSEFQKIIDFISKYIYLYKEMKEKNLSIFQDYKIKPLLMSMQTKKIIPLYYLCFLIVDLFKNFKILTAKEKKDIGRLYITIIEYLVLKALMISQGDSEPKRIICEICNITRSEFIDKEFKIDSLINFVNLKIKEKTKIKKEDFRERLTFRREDDWSSITSLILMEYKISNYLNDNSSNMEFANVSLEHIMPQDVKEWNDNIVDWNKDKIKDISINNVQEYSTNYQNMIGNFLVLSIDKNSSIKNKKFSEKINRYNKSNIVNWKIYDYKNNDLDVKNRNIWSFENIENRTNFINYYFINDLFKKFLD